MSRRNLIIVLAHGLRSDAVSDARAWPLETRHLEKLADRGLRLSATSACPADHGGMISLFTGLHARQHGYVDQMTSNLACEGWPVQLVDAGYHVAGVGCIGAIEPWLQDAVHVDDVERLDPPGCRYLAATREKGTYHAIAQQRRQRLRYGPFEPDRLLLEPEDDIDGYITRAAVDKLREMPTTKPWALIVIYNGPGNDLPPPTLYDGVANLRELEASFTMPDFTELDDLAELDYPRIMLQRMEPRKLARIRADYLGRVGLIDHGVGQLNSTLATRHDKARTWTVVTSDRGHLLGERGLVGHRSFLTAAVEVPLLIAPPSPVKLHATPGLISTVDIAATIAGLAGCDLPAAASGRSLLHVLAGDPLGMPRGNACLSEFGRRVMIETEQYKAIFDVDAARPLGLYDLLNDPDELDNLVAKSAGLNVIDAMRCRLGTALMLTRALPGWGAA